MRRINNLFMKNTPMKSRIFKFFCTCLLMMPVLGQTQYLLLPDRVFDGEKMHDDWVVLVEGNQISYSGNIGGLKLPEE